MTQKPRSSTPRPVRSAFLAAFLLSSGLIGALVESWAPAALDAPPAASSFGPRLLRETRMGPQDAWPATAEQDDRNPLGRRVVRHEETHEFLIDAPTIQKFDPQSRSLGAAGLGSESNCGLAAGDFDGDGRDEVVACRDHEDGGFIVVLDDAKAGHREIARVTDLEDWPEGIVADVDGDGREDFVAALWNGRGLTVWMLEDREPPALVARATIDSPTLRPLAAGDLDGDGADEVLAKRRDSSRLLIYGYSEGALLERDSFALPSEDASATIGNFDADFFREILLVTAREDQLRLVLFDDLRNGGFSKVLLDAEHRIPGVGVSSPLVTAADIDGNADSRRDEAVVSFNFFAAAQWDESSETALDYEPCNSSLKWDRDVRYRAFPSQWDAASSPTRWTCARLNNWDYLPIEGAFAATNGCPDDSHVAWDAHRDHPGGPLLVTCGRVASTGEGAGGLVLEVDARGGTVRPRDGSSLIAQGKWAQEGVAGHAAVPGRSLPGIAETVAAVFLGRRSVQDNAVVTWSASGAKVTSAPNAHGIASGNLDGDGILLSYEDRRPSASAIVPQFLIAAPPTVAGISQNREESLSAISLGESASEGSSHSVGGFTSLGFGWEFDGTEPLTKSGLKFGLVVANDFEVSHEFTQSETVEYSTSYETGSDENAIVYTGTSLDIYRYSILQSTVPGYEAGKSFTIDVPRITGTFLSNLQDFAAIAPRFADIGNHFKHTIGDPRTYLSPAERDAIIHALAPDAREKFGQANIPGGRWPEIVTPIGVNTASKGVDYSKSTDESNSFSHTLHFDFEFRTTFFGVGSKVDFSFGFTHAHSWSTSVGESLGYVGAIGGIASRHEHADHQYKAGPFLYPATLYDGGLEVYVLNWWTDGYTGAGPQWEPVTDAPAPVTPRDGGAYDLHEGRFEWERVPNAKSYQIEVSDVPTFERVTYTWRIAADLYHYPDFLPGYHHWRVRGLDGNLDPGPWSEPRGFFVGPVPSGPPREVGHAAGRVTWREPAELRPGVEVSAFDWVIADGDAGNLVHRRGRLTDAGARSLDLPADLPPGAYAVSIRARTDTGPGPWSEPVRFERDDGPSPTPGAGGLLAFHLGAGGTAGGLRDRSLLKDLPPALDVASGDVDADGRAEFLIVANDDRGQRPALLLDDAASGFVPLKSFGARAWHAAELVDVDGDGAAEVVLAGRDPPFGIVVYDDALGGFAKIATHETLGRFGTLEGAPGGAGGGAILATRESSVCPQDAILYLYEDRDLEGGCRGLTEGRGSLGNLRFDTGNALTGNVRSARVAPGWSATVCTGRESSGSCKEIRGSVPYLGVEYGGRVESVSVRLVDAEASGGLTGAPPVVTRFELGADGLRADTWTARDLHACDPDAVYSGRPPREPREEDYDPFSYAFEKAAYDVAKAFYDAAKASWEKDQCWPAASALASFVQADEDEAREIAVLSTSETGRSGLLLLDDGALKRSPKGAAHLTLACGGSEGPRHLAPVARAGSSHGPVLGCLGKGPRGPVLALAEPHREQPWRFRVTRTVNLDGEPAGVTFVDLAGNATPELVLSVMQRARGDPAFARYEVHDLERLTARGGTLSASNLARWWASQASTLEPRPDACCALVQGAVVGEYTPPPPEGEVTLRPPVNLDSGALDVAWTRPPQSSESVVRIGIEWSYEVALERVDEPGFTWNDSLAAPKVTTPHLEPGLYRVSVRASNGNGWTPWAVTAVEALGPRVVLDRAPNPLAPVGGAGAGPSPTLEWAPLDGAVVYNVEYKSVGAESSDVLVGVEGTTLTLPEELVTGRAYEWRVQGVTTRNESSPWSRHVGFRLLEAPDPRPGNGDRPLEWNLVAGADSYEVEIALADDAEPRLVRVSDLHAGAGLPPGEHRARVRALANGGGGPWSDALAFTVYEAPRVAPALVANSTERRVAAGSLDSGVNGTFHRLPVSWAPVPLATAYEVQVSHSLGFESIIESRTAAPTAWSSELAGGEYWVRVRALNHGAAGPWSAPIAVVVDSKATEGVPGPGFGVAALALAAIAALAERRARRG